MRFFNNLISRFWADESMNNLPVKSQGRTVLTSDFVTIVDGVLRFNDLVWERKKNDLDIKLEIAQKVEERAKRAGTILDVSSDGYYNSTKCVYDFEKVISIFNLTRISQIERLLHN